MISKVNSASLYGITGELVSVETHVARGLPGFNIVGLAGTSIKEAWLRVKSAISNSNMEFPSRRITVNLAPAGSRKEGSHFDLPMALGIALALDEVRYINREVKDAAARELEKTAFFGELSLDGNMGAIRGALPLAICAKERGMKRVVIPWGNYEEVSLVKDIEVVPCKSLARVMTFIGRGFSLLDEEKEDVKKSLSPEGRPLVGKGDSQGVKDFADVIGQEEAKRALTLCAAGAHGIIMEGNPGCGKTMLATRLTGILPPMSYEERLQVTKIYSVAGLLSEEHPFVASRPFRNPHHRVTSAALLGGGLYPKPGEFSLAHYGVLFLDELCEFDRNLLDGLRQPLEEEQVVIARSGGAVVFPGKVILVAATNPCKCGFHGDDLRECTCTASEIDRYKKKLSGPFMDRIDVHIRVPRVDVTKKNKRVSSKDMRKQVMLARKKQEKRYKGTDIISNSQVPPKLLNEFCYIKREGEVLLKRAYESLGLTMRTWHKTIRLARTIADIEDSDNIETSHIAEALGYRPKGEE